MGNASTSAWLTSITYQAKRFIEISPEALWCLQQTLAGFADHKGLCDVMVKGWLVLPRNLRKCKYSVNQRATKDIHIDNQNAVRTFKSCDCVQLGCKPVGSIVYIDQYFLFLVFLETILCDPAVPCFVKLELYQKFMAQG